MNWSEFFSMGGYAFYVWGSYLATLLVLGGEVAYLLRPKKSARQQEHQLSGTRREVTNETSS